PAEATRAGAGDQAGDEVIVARAPDEMRAEGDSEEATRFVGGTDFLLSEGVGFRVGAEEGGGVGKRFGGIPVRGAIEHDAGGGGINEFSDAGLLAGVDDMSRAAQVNVHEQVARPPDAGGGGGVKDGINAPAGIGDGAGVAKVASVNIDVQLAEARVISSAENPHLFAPVA